jgi:hypothetical protein
MTTADSLKEVPDGDWIAGLFMLPDSKTWSYEEERRYFTTADYKVGGSGLGNSRVINPPPGITDYCDTPRGWGIDGKLGTGSGVYYHEMLDQTMDVVHIRPGLPRFNSFTKFWTNAVNSEVLDDLSYGWFAKLARATGSFIAFVFTAPLWLPGKIFQFASSLIFGDNANRYSYYYLEPASLLFWRMVDNAMNDVALRIGVLGDARYSGSYDDGSVPEGDNVRDEDMQKFLANMPGVFTNGSVTGQPRVDGLTIAHRYTLITQARDTYLKDKAVSILGKTFTTDEEVTAALQTWRKTIKETPPGGGDASVLAKSAVVNKIGKDMLDMNQIMSSGYEEFTASNISSVLIESSDPHKTELDDDGAVTTKAVQIDKTGFGSENLWPEHGTPTFLEKLRNVARGGYDFVSIAVDEVSETTVSISNSVGSSGIEDRINGAVSASRGAWFAVNGGNMGDGAISSAVETVVGAGKSLLNGLASGLAGGVPQALLGGKAFLDIPDTYQSSETSYNNTSYTLTSCATSCHPISKLKMLFPYIVLLCLAAPISAGPRSMAAPMLVELHHQGKAHVNLGMITALEGKFGELDGWDINSLANKIEISFTVTNLSKNFHVPLDTDASMTYLDSGEFANHMAAITGQSLTDYDKSFSFNTKMRFSRAGFKLDRFFSSSGWAASIGVGARNIIGGPLCILGEYIDRK